MTKTYLDRTDPIDPIKHVEEPAEPTIDPIKDEELIKFGALLEEFTAHQRATALAESRRNRITMIRTMGQSQVHFEVIVDETAPSSEIYEHLKRADDACNRLGMRTAITDQYNKIGDLCRQIEMLVQKQHTDRADYERVNAEESLRRRKDIVGLTRQQQDGLSKIRHQIDDCWEKIEDARSAIKEDMRVFEGEEPLMVLVEHIDKMLEKLRPHREAA